jgi:glycosyltransferase involved in cell wall biosynthesis
MTIKSKIAFYITYDINWLGGYYYKQHLVNALLDSNDIKHLVIFTDDNSFAKIKEDFTDKRIKVENVAVSVPKGLGGVELFVRNKLGFSFCGLFTRAMRNVKVFDYRPIGILRNVRSKNRIYWIPDLQDKFLPQFFKSDVIKSKDQRYSYLAENARHIVFSSEDSLKSYLKFYPIADKTNLKKSILRFAVFHPSLEQISKIEVLNKYGLENYYYFIVSNQFMAHKNHELVIKAFHNVLKTGNKSILRLILTGKKSDPRNQAFFEEILQLVKSLNIEEEVIFTGVINRLEQLTLMKYALAVIQPSKFEGWNSTVEDVKCLNQKLICSNLKVHYEQLSDYPNVDFFNVDSVLELTSIIEKSLSNNIGMLDFDYSKKQNLFSLDLMKIFE